MSNQDICVGSRFILHPDEGTLDIVHEAQIVLHQATAHVAYRRANGDERQLALAGRSCDYHVSQSEATVTTSDDCLIVSLYIGLGEKTTLSLSITNRGADSIHLDEMAVLHAASVDLGDAPSAWRVYQNGWQSWSAAFTRSLGPLQAEEPQSQASAVLVSEPDTDDYLRKHLPYGRAGSAMVSDSFTIVKGEHLSLLAGFISTAQNLSFVRLAGNPNDTVGVQAVCCGDGMMLAGGAQFVSETLLLSVSTDPFALLDLYMNELGSTMSARVPDAVPTGWCTWYYYYGQNTEDDVLANLKATKDKALPLEYILLDDGYAAALGDWTTASSNFPHGVPWLAEQIRAAGMKPGIWLAPFGTAQDSRLYTEHPDWVLKNADGSPVIAWQHFGVERPILALDCTNPQVQDWLGDIFRVMADDWGMELFKIDFCFAAALPGQHHDASATRAMALRKGLEVIREAVGDRFVLGCGMPLGPAVGIVDGMRISTDVSFTWQSFVPDPTMPSTSNALRNVVTRYASHSKLWLNDPDCVIARSRYDANNMTFDETRTLVALMGLSGGMVLDGDNLTTLSPARHRYLQKLLPPSNLSATSLDLFEHGFPGLLALPCAGAAGTYTVLASINWHDTARETAIDLSDVLGKEDAAHLPAMHAYDLLNERYLGTVTGKISLGEVHVHGGSLLLLKPVSDRPELLASTFHILGGLVEVKSVAWDSNRLRVVVEKRGKQTGKLVFAIPPGNRLLSVRVNNRLRRWKQPPTEIAEIPLTIADHALVELAFA